MRLLALPTINLPERSHETPKPKERRQLPKARVVQEDSDNKRKNPCYKDFKTLENRISKLKLNDWTYAKKDETTISLKYFLQPFITPKYELLIDESLGFTCGVFGFLLPDDHLIYKKYFRSIRNTTVTNILNEILSFKLCDGVTDINSTDLILHSVQKELTNEVSDNSELMRTSKHCKNCELLHLSPNLCEKCNEFMLTYNKKKTKENCNLEKPAHKNAPLSKTHPKKSSLP